MIDKLLPTLKRDLHNPQTGLLDKAQHDLAFGIARRNTILAHLRGRTKTTLTQSQNATLHPDLEVGDMVHVMNRDAKKHDPPWLPGYRIVAKRGATCFDVHNHATGSKLTRNLKHLCLAEPVELLLDNTSLSSAPRLQLYLHFEHIPDLHWLIEKHKIILSPEQTRKAKQLTDLPSVRSPPIIAPPPPTAHDTAPDKAPIDTTDATNAPPQVSSRGRRILPKRDPLYQYHIRLWKHARTNFRHLPYSRPTRIIRN